MFARRLCVAAALAASLAVPATAAALDTNISWALGQSTTTYGGPTQFNVTSGGNDGFYRWSETVGRDTVISGNRCSDGSAYRVVSIGAGDQSFKQIVDGFGGTCFLLRGRVASGQGSTTTRSGVVRR